MNSYTERTQTHAADTRTMFDKYATILRQNQQQDRDDSMELMTVPAVDSEKERLKLISKDLEEERRKFTEAAIMLGKERAAFEVGFSPVLLTFANGPRR